MSTTILPPERILGGTVTEVEHPAGMLRFEEFREGEWLTLKGEPAKKGRRCYFLDGVELDSVSAIVGVLEKQALYRWYEDRGARGAVKAERLGELKDVPEEEWIQRVRALNLGAEAVRDEGADRGHAVHEAFHTLATVGKLDPDDFPQPWLPYLKGAMRAWLALDPKVIDAEFMVCHPEQGYAGRPDLYAICEGKPTLIDYKTSAKGRIYSAASWQTRGYAEAFPFAGLPEPERIVIVAINGDGGFEVKDCQVTGEEWAALVTVRRAHRRVGG